MLRAASCLRRAPEVSKIMAGSAFCSCALLLTLAMARHRSSGPQTSTNSLPTPSVSFSRKLGKA
jgi:hypothetical protein